MKLVDTLVVGGLTRTPTLITPPAPDARGALLAAASFSTTSPGYARLLGCCGLSARSR
jgi:hypothetical protein